jgi:hypothetical protein
MPQECEEVQEAQEGEEAKPQAEEARPSPAEQGRSEMRYRAHRLSLSLALSLALLGVCSGFAATAPAGAVSAAGWQILQAPHPTNFVPGAVANGSGYPQIENFITNVGGSGADGVVITDTLPEGLSVSATVPPEWEYAPPQELFKSGDCDAVGQVVTCEVPFTVDPAAVVRMKIPVDVSATAPATVMNKVVVEGEGFAESNSEITVSPNPAPFAILPGPGLAASLASETGGAPAAGSHPFIANFNIGVPGKPYNTIWYPTEAMRGVSFELPQGLVINPTATAKRCTQAEANETSSSFPIKYCPEQSQVGLAYIGIPGFLQHGVAPVYNMVPPPGAPAALMFELENTTIMVIGGLSGGFHLTAGSRELITKFGVAELSLTLWGVPSDPRFDRWREGGTGCRGCSEEPSPAPFVTAPTSCTEATNVSATVTSWLGNTVSATRPLTDANYDPLKIDGCNALEFIPTIASKATTNVADSPSGLDFNLHQPQNEQLDGLATAALKDSTVTLPEGMNLNPAVADGLSACSEAQMGYAPEGSKIRFSTTPQSCPDAAKLGTVEIKTPLLGHKLPGAIYLAKPYENPFGNLTAIYLAIEDEESGIVAKLAGKATPDPVTGQLTASFTENPELPVEDIDLHFFGGARAPFTTPLTCGTKTTTSVLTPWSTPEGKDATPSDSFQTQVPAGGSGNCPSSEANAPNKPSFTAGTVAPEAGAYSPFVLRLTRPDGTQRLTAIDTTLPKGLAAKFAGIPYCSEAQIAQAQARSTPNQGALERSNPSCPAASEVGTVEVGAGSGPTPTYVSGHAYLAGPYKGAPLSLAIITPAVAGPFDLGAVVVRTALYIDPETAQGRAVSDPLPSILQGIPLDIRSIAVKLDRPGGFTLNPTSCDPMAITGSATALTGQSAALTSPFQVGGCSALKFKPSLKISLKGGTKRHRFPALKAVLTYPKGANANIASTQVTLPHGEFLEQGHIGTVCTRVQFAVNACPKASIYGKAKAITPLLDKPLEGPVYLRSSSHELPDLVAALNGQIDVVLAGRVDTGKGGGIRNTFEAVPDAPVSKFVLEMKGGKKGLLVNSEDICRKPQRASVSFTAQNGKAFDATPLIANSCKGKAKKKHAKKGAHGKKGGKGK